MSPRLILADAETARDVLTFVGRAQRVGDEGVRFQAAEGVMVVTAAPLAPAGLLDQTPLVLAVRIVRADPKLRCDIVVEEVGASEEPAELTLPETGLAPAWAGMSPPRSGWERVGELAASDVARRAQWGISAVARGAGSGAGEEAVRALRASIWGAPDEELGGLPLGVAFVADAFGFVSGEETAVVTKAGRWTRVAFSRGHVLTRGPAVSGLTAVRATGASSG